MLSYSHRFPFPSTHSPGLAKLVSKRLDIESLSLGRERCTLPGSLYVSGLVDVNGYVSAHARRKVLATIAIDRDDDRDALPNFGEVAAGVILCR
jgi:hypothetical protein